MTSTSTAMTGSQVQLMAGPGMNSTDAGDLYAAFITVTGPVWAPVTSSGSGKYTVTIPKGVAGQSYVVLTKGNKQATDDNIVAGPAIIEVGQKMGAMGSMTTPTSSMTGPMSSTSPSKSASSTPMFNGANDKKVGLAGVTGAGLFAAVAMLV
ncbi:hypothetical protein N7533_003840 [Penicillium manginii]|uniref:uncharacterized protein n=1 Tax=Penicillium manginii TaxID=203109 RepID=UPI002547E9E4|nr:uncharacterized protein N7533_003840 [Penicillium manginii]KAJ5754297.1 hypothetical protein N7533_003840 [Penicillium manginii]